MAQLSNLLLRLAQQLFPDQRERYEFVTALTYPQPGDAYLLWCQPRQPQFETQYRVNWLPDFVDRIAPQQHPEKQILCREGAYHPVEFSTLFAFSPLQKLTDSPKVLLDLCATSGGCIFTWQLCKPQLLLANAIAPPEHALLLATLRRCGITPAATLKVNVDILAQVIPKTADFILLTPPSTRQSLLARGKVNPGCCHPGNIRQYAQRQKRLLTAAAALSAPQGHILYSTRTYSLEENEGVLHWFLDRFPEFRAQSVPHLRPYQSDYTQFPAYRLFPHQRLSEGTWGAGGFTVLLQHQSQEPLRSLPPQFLTQSRITIV